MSRFMITKNPPQILEKNEFVIGKPDFFDEIRASKAKKPRSNLITINYLREVISAIGQKYIGDNFDALRAVNVSRFVGVPCNTEEQIHDVLIKAFETQCPELLLAYVHHRFKQRPAGTNLIYYTGNPKFSTKLVELGYQQVSEKEVEETKGNKTKKVVGKPAITAEQAAVLSNGQV